MSFKNKPVVIVLLGLFVATLLVTLRAHFLLKDYEARRSQDFGLSTSQWASENLYTIVQTLEAGAKGLDQSTISTLERFGVDYFAHAYPNKEGWRFAPRALGEFKKDGVKEQLKDVVFANLKEDERNWIINDSHVQLFSPVSFIGSKKMGSGFAVYGIRRTSFEKWFVTSGALEVLSKSSNGFQNLLGDLDLKSPVIEKISEPIEGAVSETILWNGKQFALFFQPGLQLWLVSHVPAVFTPFWTGPLVKALCFGFLALSLLLLIVARNWKSPLLASLSPALATRSEESSLGDESLSSEISFLKALIQRLQIDLSHMKTSVSQMDEPLLKTDVIRSINDVHEWLGEVPSLRREVKNFGFLIDLVLNLKESQLDQHGIQVDTQIEDDVRAHCSVEAVEDFLLRLMDQSILELKKAKHKKITIQLKKTSDDEAQFIYTDSRDEGFPKKNFNKHILQMESPLNDIHGLLSLGRLVFQEDLSWKSEPFELFVRLSETPAATTMPIPPSSGDESITSLDSQKEAPTVFEIEDQPDESLVALLKPLEINPAGSNPEAPMSTEVPLDAPRQGLVNEKLSCENLSSDNLSSEKIVGESVGAQAQDQNKGNIRENIKDSVEGETQDEFSKETQERSEVSQAVPPPDPVLGLAESDSLRGPKLPSEKPIKPNVVVPPSDSKARRIDEALSDFQMEEFQFTNLTDLPPIPSIDSDNDFVQPIDLKNIGSASEPFTEVKKDMKNESVSIKVREPKKGGPHVSHN